MKYVLTLIIAFITLPLNAHETTKPHSATAGKAVGRAYISHATTQATERFSGIDPETGRRWTTVVDRTGNMRGVDKNGHRWQYDVRSNTYHNYATGRLCTGIGGGRICN